MWQENSQIKSMPSLITEQQRHISNNTTEMLSPKFRIWERLQKKNKKNHCLQLANCKKKKEQQQEREGNVLD